MSTINLCREGHYRALRARLLEIEAASASDVARMSDRDVVSWFEERGYASYVAHTGGYDDDDDILIVRADAIGELVREGEAFWAERCHD